jgi:hypothetical protein
MPLDNFNSDFFPKNASGKLQMFTAKEKNKKSLANESPQNQQGF